MKGQIIVTVESIKMQSHIVASAAGMISDLKVTEKISEQIITLPLHSNMKNEDVDYIISCIKKFK